MSEMTILQIADHMIAVHGGLLAARDWAELHATANVGRNPAAVKHWDAVAAELTRKHKER